MNRIVDERLRQITFYKRRKGLLKKAMELSLLCESQVFLVVLDSTAKKILLYNNMPSEQLLFNEVIKSYDSRNLYKNKDVTSSNNS